MQINSHTELEKFYLECNENNKTEGIETDIVDSSKFNQWKYYNVEPEIDLLGLKINYSMFRYQNHESKLDKQLIVIPGFSKKSICWTLGRINLYLEKLQEIYSDICIFNLIDLKNKTELLKGQGHCNYEIYKGIGSQLNKILKSMGKNNISLLGRSAGGALAIILSSINDNVNGLNLACPGYEDQMIQDFVDSGNMIPIRMVWAEEDTKIPIEKGDKLNTILSANKFDINFIKVSTGKSEHKYNHRIQKELIDILV